MLKKILKACALTAGMIIPMLAQAFDSSTDYNTANMSYPADSTISQIVVFDNAMQAGTNLTFTVDAHAGGGRNLQHDTGQLKLEFYNSSNTLLGSAQTSYATGNLLMANTWSSVPGDNPADWQTLTLSTSTCGSAGSCAGVAYMKVIMIGTDTSWWAGNYGPQWRLPTLTSNGGNNIIYNPEFGSYNGVMAQGWTSSSGWGACGTTSGSVMCTTTTAGTANSHGGGPSATGGTTSGQAGGYSSTLTVANANAGTGGGASLPPAPTTTTSTNAAGSTVTASLGQTTDTSITNNGTIAVTGTNAGINATSDTTTTISNAGSITTDNGTGINAQQSTSTTSNVTVTNSGSVTANTSGTTTIVNGQPTSVAHGIVTAFNGTGSTSTATINNTTTGTITVTNGDGVVMVGYGTNILNNDGSITSTPTGTNSMPSVLMQNAATLNNNGTITGDVGVDFANTSAGSTINNNATGVITGGSGMAIISVGSTTGMIINNAGTITGDVQLTTNGILNQLGSGSIAGAVRTKDATAVVNIGSNAVAADTVLLGNLGDPANTTVATGTYGNFPMTFTAQPLSALNIFSNSSLTANNSYTVNATTVNNNGSLVVGAGANLTVNSSTFNMNGSYSFVVNSLTSYGQLTVNGPVTLGNNVRIIPIFTNNTAQGGIYAGVLSSTGLTGFSAVSGTVGIQNWNIATQSGNANVLDLIVTSATTPVPGTPQVTRTPTGAPSTDTDTVTRGNPTILTVQTYTATRNGDKVAINRHSDITTTTPLSTVRVTTTPTTVTTTPVINNVDSSGNTVSTTLDTANATSVVVNEVTATTNVVTAPEVLQRGYNETGSASTAALGDAIKYSRTNPFLVDPLASRNANWIAPRAAYYSVNGGKHMVGGISFGRQHTVENNTVGFAFDASQADSHGYLNNVGENKSYSATAYLLSKQDYLWYKAAVGGGTMDHNSTVRIPQFGMINSSKAKQNMFYTDLGVYSAESFGGFRPFAGVTVVHSQIGGYTANGNPLIAPQTPAKRSTQTMPYAGVRWEYDKDVGLEFRVTQTKDFKTVGGVRATVKKQISEDVSIDFIAGADKGSKYNNFYGMVGLTFKF